jgi:sporulation protein YlmC with PRC-barrel domain
MRTLAAIVVVASLVTGIALVIDVPAQQTVPPAAQPGQPSSDPSAQPSAQPSTAPASPAPASPSTDSAQPAQPSVQITPPAPAPPPASARSAPPASTDGGQLHVDASAVLGSTVRNTEGKDIGRVSRLMMDPREGKIATVVIGIGGMLGIGEKLVSLPWNAVRVTQDRGQVVIVADQRLLEQAPAAERTAKGGEPAASPATSGGNGSQNSQKK